MTKVLLQRGEAISQLRGRRAPFDLAIIGGGATGLGAAVDAAARGHAVCLLERADFAKGTSSRSTKLVHGGVRYLRQGHIPLVLEALRERGRLHRNAPHLVHPLPFVIPAYRWWDGPFYGIGMKLYDQLAGELGLERSRRLSLEETLTHIPTIEQDSLTGGVLYHDAQFDDARLAVTLARTAQALGAVVLNYVACVGLMKSGGRIVGVLARDAESGEEWEIPARAVINATGVWVDDLRKQDTPHATDIVAVSQGVHLVLPHEFLPGDSAIMIPRTDDNRVLFAVPWHGRVVLGTTDTPLNDRAIEPTALPAERDFLMQHAARYLTRDPRPSDVLSIFAGLRPLVRQAGAESTAVLSREHTILMSDSGLISIAGGKWTTYRKMAEDVIDTAQTIAGLLSRPCVTADLRLHGWTDAEIGEAHLEVYGAEADEIRRLAQSAPALAERIHPRLAYLQAEVLWHVRHELARSVEDVLARRTRALFLDARAAIEAAPTVAAIMAPELDEDEAWQRHSVAAFREVAEAYVFARN